ncbi:hypothetical protein, partial [Methyloglobulus morosus]|uniref:hypothetical protein n=1 Tax=Methyloglobulus morosus TaxID=1410681 RepID=UPI00128F6D22
MRTRLEIVGWVSCLSPAYGFVQGLRFCSLVSPNPRRNDDIPNLASLKLLPFIIVLLAGFCAGGGHPWRWPGRDDGQVGAARGGKGLDVGIQAELGDGVRQGLGLLFQGLGG